MKSEAVQGALPLAESAQSGQQAQEVVIAAEMHSDELSAKLEKPESSQFEAEEVSEAIAADEPAAAAQAVSAESDAAVEPAIRAEAPSTEMDQEASAVPNPEAGLIEESPEIDEQIPEKATQGSKERAKDGEAASDPAKIPEADAVKNAEKIKSSTVIGVAVVLIAVIAVIYFAAKQASAPAENGDNQKVTVATEPESGKVSIIEEATADDIGVLVNSGKTVWSKTEVFAFLGNSEKNSGANDCSLVYAAKRTVDKKYDSNMMNAISGLLQPVTAAEKEAGYFSAIPSGTTLKYLKLDDSGAIEANFSGAINNAAGSCAVTAIRSQIKSTLMQFSAVKSVVICVDGECDDGKILQP